MKKFLLFIFFLLSFFIFPKPAHAQSNFLTSVDATYTIKESGITHVDLHFKLKNKTGSYYASSYTLDLGFHTLNNMAAFDDSGQITPTIKTQNDKTEVTLQFNEHVVGTGNILPFTLSFDTPDVANNIGKIWEVTIPGITDQEQFEQFNVHVAAPSSFGKPAYIKPATFSNTLDFSKEQLSKAGITIGFGSEQVYTFSLQYHLANTNIYPVRTEIALPPSTNYQDVYIDTIQPPPTNVVKDKDGNWLAKYYLLPTQKLDIVTKGKAVISLKPKVEYSPDNELQVYLQDKQYWQTNDKHIQTLAQSLKTPQAIYAYVTKNLQYDFSRVTQEQERLGAVGVLNQPNSAVCLEFTDLLIALARAAGIPAREVDGYAYTQNTKEKPLSLVRDVLHAWPEYYDKDTKRWIMIDPTWGNTTNGMDYFHSLDFDHFAFAIKGLSGTYPVPGGGYKLTGQTNNKDVSIDFDTNLPDTTPHMTAELTFPKTVFSNEPIHGTITVKNTGNAEVPSQQIIILSDILTPQKRTIVSERIPPFGYVEIPIQFDKSNFLTNQKTTVTIQLAGQTFQKAIAIYPILSDNVLIIGGIILVSLTIVISIITATTRRISVSRRKK